MADRLIIAVDFDGTCVKHAYPVVGEDIGAQKVLRALVQMEHKIILFTMRSGSHLDAAVQWFANNDIPLFGINENPEQHTWTTSPKPYAHLYIDDAALGCPLVHPDQEDVIRPWVDWNIVAKMFRIVNVDVDDGEIRSNCR